MADSLNTLKECEKEYRKLLRDLLKRVRKLRRQLEKQPGEKATRSKALVEKMNEEGASDADIDTPLFTAALDAFRLAMLGRPSRN